MRFVIPTFVLLFAIAGLSFVADAADTSRGDEMVEAYFRAETQKLADRCLTKEKSFKDWANHRDEYRTQLLEMLGLDPLPERTSLEPVITGTLDHGDFTVEKLHFQSRPHLYVTGNLYLPKDRSKPAPTILYLCGHHLAKKNGVSFGNKTWYQHHGAWLAQNGYVCLLIDTLQLGEIEGIHDGTRRKDRWWWNARGYSPSGVEAWNAIRALDYLITRPEVDATRIGVTGRSGGGAYSWTTAALDDRVKVAVPVAGITSLKNYVVDECIKGHCDCMFFVNTYRWDYPQLAAMTAPRPLLISNTDRDEIFPLDGVVETYRKVRRLYELDKKGPDIALQTGPGPHSDGQVLQLQALQWFNHYLKGEKEPSIIESAAKSYYQPEELRVFEELPADEINTKIDESFVPLAVAPIVPKTKAEWASMRDAWMKSLREKCFRGWPEESDTARWPLIKVAPAKRDTSGGLDLANVSEFRFTSQDGVELPLVLVEPPGVERRDLKRLVVWPLSDKDWQRFSIGRELGLDESGERKMHAPVDYNKNPPWPDLSGYKDAAVLFVMPRGVGPTAWTANAAERINIRRQFMLLGQTLDGMRVWDVRRAIQSARQVEGLADVPLTVHGDGEMAGIALYAALFEPKIAQLELSDLATTHRSGPDFLNVLRFLDVPQAVALAAENSHVTITEQSDGDWDYAEQVAKALGWNDAIALAK